MLDNTLVCGSVPQGMPVVDAHNASIAAFTLVCPDLSLSTSAKRASISSGGIAGGYLSLMLPGWHSSTAHSMYADSSMPESAGHVLPASCREVRADFYFVCVCLRSSDMGLACAGVVVAAVTLLGLAAAVAALWLLHRRRTSWQARHTCLQPALHLQRCCSFTIMDVMHASIYANDIRRSEGRLRASLGHPVPVHCSPSHHLLSIIQALWSSVSTIRCSGVC